MGKDKEKEKEKEKEDEWGFDNGVYGLEVVQDMRSILYHMYTFINFSDSVSLNYITQVLR